MGGEANVSSESAEALEASSDSSGSSSSSDEDTKPPTPKRKRAQMSEGGGADSDEWQSMSHLIARKKTARKGTDEAARDELGGQDLAADSVQARGKASAKRKGQGDGRGGAGKAKAKGNGNKEVSQSNTEAPLAGGVSLGVSDELGVGSLVRTSFCSERVSLVRSFVCSLRAIGQLKIVSSSSRPYHCCICSFANASPEIPKFASQIAITELIKS